MSPFPPTPAIWFLSIVFGSVGLLYIAFNYIWLAQQLIYKRFVSLVPLVGPIFGSVGLFFCPIAAVRWWWWLPWLVDPGTLMLVAALPYLFFDYSNRKR